MLLLILILLLIIPPMSCTHKEEPSLYRLIDHLERENILISPFLEFNAENPKLKEENPSLYEIADDSPLLDFGIDQNPFLLKKKLKIGTVEINTLLAPPTSRYRFTKKISAPSFLEFTYGIRRSNELAQKKDEKQFTEFSIVIESENKKTEIFKNTLDISPDKALVFDYKKLNLSQFKGKSIQIHLITRGNNKSLACWFNPVVYTPLKNTKNVVLISLDTLRPDHLGCYGYSRNTSPSIDSLAQDSTIFQNTYATSPWTLPSHVSLLTSLNCIHHQVYHQYHSINPSLLTLADFLRAEGYFNGAITGGGFVSGQFGFSKGFDSYLVRGQIQSPTASEAACHAALEWIERHQDRNFFLFLHTYQIHNPYSSPAPYNELFLHEGGTLKEIDLSALRLNHENRFKSLTDELRQNIIDLYDSEIRYTDESLIKPLVDKLKSLNLYNNTMIILTSDHGEEFFEHKSWHHTHSVYNETIKIPLIIKFFDSEHRGKRITKLSRIIDIIPTILDALHIDPFDYKMDGESLLVFLRNDDIKKDERVFISELAPNVMGRHIQKKVAINRNGKKLILNSDFTQDDLDYFFRSPPEIQQVEVFDMKTDPEELINIAQDNPRLARELLDFLKEKNRQTGEASSEKLKMSKELLEQLKALGYIR